jgi:transcriptional regulator with XRE-family HTH domain
MHVEQIVVMTSHPGCSEQTATGSIRPHGPASDDTDVTVSDLIAERLRAVRAGLGWTAADLAAACARAGQPKITAAVIANIETGRRNPDGSRRRQVSADEMLLFAAVLKIPPADLLADPLADDGDHGPLTRIAPGRPLLSARQLARWLTSGGDGLYSSPGQPAPPGQVGGNTPVPAYLTPLVRTSAAEFTQATASHGDDVQYSLHTLLQALITLSRAGLSDRQLATSLDAVNRTVSQQTRNHGRKDA